MSHANRLISESSPYLVQHAHNPVDWYPWGKEALEKAKSEDKPIFLSIGYSSCHWCHVMAKECFEDKEIAGIMNRNFVCIKVDREERPDIDELYMSAVQMMTGRSGWPLNVFLTPDIKPFFGGTYFPPEPLPEIDSLPNVLKKIAKAYREQKDIIVKGGEALINTLCNSESKPPNGKPLLIDGEFLDQERNRLLGIFDDQYGGFGETPKFPQPGALLFLIDEFWRTNDSYLLKLTDTTLDRMAAGGIHDHIGGGFHRYAVDRQWRIPHFEKMLYDNALLARVYTRAWQIMGKDAHAVTGRKILDFLLYDMRDPRGGFYSAIDADSDHEEGKFYIWTMEELQNTLGLGAAQRFAKAYGVAHDGNFFGGKNILYLPRDLKQTARMEGIDPEEFNRELELSREALSLVRSERRPPLTDKKIITAWNGLAIGSLSLAGTIFGEERYLAAARRAADYILRRHKNGSGLAHSSINDRASGPAFLDDYAFLIQGLLDLYTATLRGNYLTDAVQLAKEMLQKFQDGEGGLYFAPEAGPEDISLPTRPRKMLDGATPSPNAVALEVISRIAEITQNELFVTAAKELESELSWAVRSVPWGSHYALKVASTRLLPHSQVVIVGPANAEETRALAQEARRHSKPDVLMVWGPPGKKGASMRAISPLLKGKRMKNHQPTAYFCSGHTCFPPITEANKLREFLRSTKKARQSN